MYHFADVLLYLYIYYYPVKFFVKINMQLMTCNIYPNHAAEVPAGRTLY